MSGPTISVAVIGRGAIGGPIIEALASGAAQGAELAGVLVRDVRSDRETDSLETLLARRPTLVIEAAGHAAAREVAVPVIASGADLLTFSVGALADREFEACCRREAARRSAGRVLLSTGAIGGMDMLKSLVASGTLRTVRLTSTTLPASLVQPWMDNGEAERIEHTREAMAVFAGTARDASQKFPAVANVAATVGLSTLGLDRVTVECRADPMATMKRHEIEAVSEETRCTFTIENAFSPSNPRTSAITPYAALRLIRDRIESFVAGV